MCGTDSTPQWRRTLDGKGHAPLLCNSCGLKERRAKKRLEEAMREGRVRDDGTIERRAATRDDDSSSKSNVKSKSPPARNKTRSRTGPIVNPASVVSGTPGSSASSSAATSPRGHEFSFSNPVYTGYTPDPPANPRSTSGRRAAATAAAAAIAANVSSPSSTSAPAVPPPPPPFMMTGFGMLHDGSLSVAPPPPLEPALLVPRASSTTPTASAPMRSLAASQGSIAAMMMKQETPRSPAITSPKRRRRLNAEGDSGRTNDDAEAYDESKHR
jgi:hypothetical protein